MIVRTAFLAVSFVAIGFWVCATSAADREKTPPSAKQRRDEIRKLIEQLNAEAFKDRETAMRRLMERDDALAALKEAAKSDNAEVRRRAEKAIEAINKRLGKRAIQRAVAKLKKGQTDQFVEQVFAWREYMDEEGWKGALEHAQAIADKAGKLNGGHKYKALPRIELAKLKFSHTDHLKMPECHQIQRQGVITEDANLSEGLVRDDFLICRGAVKVSDNLGWSVIFLNGDLNIGTPNSLGTLLYCIVVCDGNVTVSSDIADCVVLATGTVSVGGDVQDSVIICGGDLKVGLAFPGAGVKNSFVQTHQRDPLNFIHFFDLAEQGIEVKASRQKIRVEDVATTKPFAKSGVRKGDCIEAVAGVKVNSVEELRRQLRRRMQESNAIRLDVRRENELLPIDVRFPEDAP
jgi:hypothetical protein